jgi:uncharacterized MnhB-related membrane protein
VLVKQWLLMLLSSLKSAFGAERIVAIVMLVILGSLHSIVYVVIKIPLQRRDLLLAGAHQCCASVLQKHHGVLVKV